MPRLRDLLGPVGILVVSLLFVAAGIGMVATGAEGGVPAVLFFGACAAVAVWQLWPGWVEGGFVDPEVVLKRFPGPVELRSPRRKHALLAAVALAFAGACLLMARAEPMGWKAAFLWLGVAFFGGAVPVLLLLLVKGGSLRLDRDGLSISQAWTRRVVAWSEVGEFEVAEVPPSSMPMVVFDDLGATPGRTAAANLALVGRNSGLPDSYGLPPAALAALMNAWRLRALGGVGTPLR